MIYFDNSSTSLIKPPGVAEAVARAINSFGNAGRSFHGATVLANREIYNTRAEIAKLIGLDNPLNIAFTSSATESLNLVIAGLVGKTDSVITTVTEHNSVLRPLYQTGCELSFIDCDKSGNLLYDSFEQTLKQNTKVLVCTHGSNVTGNITDAYRLYDICKARNIIMIMDIAQTFGTFPVKIDMADIFCFTGHKGLFGPQGTGGVIVNGEYDFRITKTGGSGANSFDTVQSKDMPDIFEIGTVNSHGIYGLQKGVQFINNISVDKLHEKEMHLLKMFYDGVSNLQNLRIYGDFTSFDRLPIISINVDGLTSPELAERLWTDYNIATRQGSHCAPLMHKSLGTADIGMVRFSFSYFNTEQEVEKAVSAMNDIVKSLQ